MNPDNNIINQILQINKNIKFGILTNGHKFNKPWQDFFNNHGKFVNFSVNASTKKTYDIITSGGNWDELISNIKSTIKNKHSKLDVRLSMVILNENYKEISSFAQLCKDIGATTLLYFLSPNHFPKDHEFILNEFEKAHIIAGNLIPNKQTMFDQDGKWVNQGIGVTLETIKGYINNRLQTNDRSNSFICAAPFRKIIVGLDGSVNSCCQMPQYIGNLKTHSIDMIWNNEQSKNTRTYMLNRKFKEIGCAFHLCPYFD
jgi:MoaA/NifB/PqqE/SkfB family radical SAM enzyme